ncbi:MAG TPA: SIMPL domain-containing protein [Anaerolineae bacterium]|nr:SIMPL domain-containing protein [Anaerolineae bacterium]
MKRMMIFALMSITLFTVVSACAPASTLSADAGETITRQIGVTGSGQVVVTPDMATINIGVRSQAVSLAEAIRQNNAQAQAIKEVLVVEGVDEKDIQTSNFNVYPQSDYDTDGNIVRTYFEVDNSLYVTVRDLHNLGDLLDTVAMSGANTIYGINFDLQDKTDALKQARELAVEYARVQAEEVAAAAGVELGEVISIRVQSSDAPVWVEGMGGGGYDPKAYSSVPVSAGRMTITTNVDIVFAIK